MEQQIQVIYKKSKEINVKIQLNNGDIEEIKDQLAAQDYLCCRSYFYLN